MKRIIFKTILFGLVLTTISSCSSSKSDKNYPNAPAGNKYCQIDKNGETIIPNGRIIRPSGKQFITAPHPYGLALSNDGNIAITANSGVRPFSITVIKGINEETQSQYQIPEGYFTDRGALESVFMGLATSNDDKLLYASGGIANKIFIFELSSGKKLDSINCNVPFMGEEINCGYLGDMVMTKDGKTLYVVDQANFLLNIISLEDKKITNRVKVGRYPFSVTLSPDESKVYVANVGMYEYKRLEGITPQNAKEAGLRQPVSAYLSEQSIKGYKANDSITVPPLGEPNVPESFSVWAIDVSQEEPIVISKIKTGFLVGDLVEGIPAVGGSGPNSLVANDKYVFVSNGNNDLVSVIDLKTERVVKNIPLILDKRMAHLRGVIPFGLAMSPDGKRLFVAEAGINAVAVIDANKLKLLGHIPTGWFPAKVCVTPDNKKLVVANAKGFGSGPNGGEDFKPTPAGAYIGCLMYGSVSVIDMPSNKELKKLTQQVVENNFDFNKIERQPNPIPLYPGEKESPIKYIVFITKENRTYDEVFGENEKGKGYAPLARYGVSATFSNRSKTVTLSNVNVMPNHQALAQQFSISDNFYVDSDVSADGHRWLTCTYPNHWVESNAPASYGGGQRHIKDAPGSFAFVGSSGAIYPEDYNEAGSMWEHFDRHNVSLYNFGLSHEFAQSYSDSTLKYGGERYLVNYPVPAPVFINSSPIYPTYNTAIPDQFRASIFIDEYTEKWLNKGINPPSFISVLLPNDHGAGERPHAGYPFRESYMMDNDLALGRIIQFLSSTPYWKNMAIFITEDDAQDGRDHVDAHRSLLMVISPYAKKGYVSHVHNSFGSIFKTFWNILGLPYLNQYDAGATDLSDMFTSEPDYTPYNAIAVDPRCFDPQKALTPFDEDFDWKELSNSPKLDDINEMHKYD
ncbi:MAG: bifunctional YncE family protein/alkaline phosphatase family protein [Bacteroidales bacterium]